MIFSRRFSVFQYGRFFMRSSPRAALLLQFADNELCIQASNADRETAERIQSLREEIRMIFGEITEKPYPERLKVVRT